MNHCPHCGRRFLSKSSACCNWCGKEIEDAAYQAQAQTEREAFFAHQATHDAQSLAGMRALNTNSVDPMRPNIPLIDGPLLGFDPRSTASRERSRQSRDDRAIQLSVEKALADQKAEEMRQTTTNTRTATGFPQRPTAAQTAPPAVPESPEEVPEVRDDRFSHLEF